MRRNCTLILTALCFAALPARAQVSISEVCPSYLPEGDGLVLVDEDGDSPDWIELRNHSSAEVDLRGWCLSDDAADPRKWALPNETLAPDERILIWASGKGSSEPVLPRYHPLVTQGDEASYFVGTQEPPATWRDVGFDDSAWGTGPSGFGYGDGDDATFVQAGSVYLRFEFDCEAKFLRILDGLYLHVDFDDAYVAHLNGREIKRENLNSFPGTPVSYDTYAPTDHEAILYQGGQLEPTQLRPLEAQLRPGENVLAVQVHNVNATSSDMTLIAFLTATTAAPVGELPHPSLIFKSTGQSYPNHTNFKLSASGEELVLTNPQGAVVDSLEMPQVYINTSFGRSELPGAGEAPLHFKNMTPGSPNIKEGRPGYASALRASPEGRMINSGIIAVTFTPEEGAPTIHYTTDCSEPTEDDPIVTGPVFPVGGPTSGAVLRARAFQDGLWPGPICTNTYLIGAGPVGDLPVFSLVTEPDNLWDWQTGIHVLGPNAGSPPWYDGANFWNNWERPLHVEFFENDQTRAVGMDLGTKIHGNFSRTHPQKSFRLIARGGYGEGSIEHAFFDDVESDSFKTLLLRNSGNDYLYANCRDPLVHLVTEGTDIDDQAYRPALVYLNGEYWGLMGLRERVDEDYLENHYDVDPDRVDLLEFGGSVVEGSSDHYFEMLQYATANDLSDDAHFAVIESMMDTHNYAKYVAQQVWCNNTDWPQNNIKFWRPQGPDGRWRWILYDTDFGLGLWGGPATNNALGRLFDECQWYNVLFVNLMENEAFRDEFICVFADLMNTKQSATNVLSIVDEVESALIQDMPSHLAKWGGNYSSWQGNMFAIRNFAANRVQNCRNHVRSQFDHVTDSFTLALDIQPPGAGRIKLTSITVEDAFLGSYFGGVPMTIEARPNSGFDFVGWTVPPIFGGSVPQREEIELNLTSDFSLIAVFEPSTEVDEVIINEIQYNPARGADTGDWVELHNRGLSAVSLEGWELRDENNTYVIPPGTEISSFGFLTLCSDLSAFTAAYPAATNVIGDIGFGLSGGGERIELHSQLGLHDVVEYDDTRPWPSGPDGNGPTLELINSGSDNALPGSWAESSVLGGTPGERNSVSL